VSLVFEGPRRVIFGPGSLDHLGREVRNLHGERVFLVVDPVVAKKDFYLAALESINKAGAVVAVFSDFHPEPAPEEADAGARLARQKGSQVVVGLGGGSAMDVAKAVAGLTMNNGKARDYLGVELLPRPGLPKIMVPTTAGTGSEVTWTAVFTMSAERRKGGINSPFLYPETALLDPNLTADLPPDVTAYTGLDALAHAVEAFCAKRSNPISDMYALKAIGLIGRALPRAVAEGAKAPQAREEMLMGAFLAGKALAGAGVGACHGLAYPLGAFHGVGHGLANAVLLPHVMQFNSEALPEKFAQIGQTLGVEGDRAAQHVARMLEEMKVPASLSALGIPKAALSEMAEAALQVKLCMDNNPRPMAQEEVFKLYKGAF